MRLQRDRDRFRSAAINIRRRHAGATSTASRTIAPVLGQRHARVRPGATLFLVMRSRDILYFVRMASDVATCMDHTGLDSFTGEEVYTAKRLRDRKLQRAL